LLHALEVYESGSDRRFRDGEVARSSFKLAEVLGELGEVDEAGKYREKAQRLRQQLLGSTCSPVAVERDFDLLVSPWAR
jgi:hypothetical protein